jgi:SAM-dependent methyltransferase
MNELVTTGARPAPFSAYTTPEFWDDPHISAQMLAVHLDPYAAPASRPHAFIAHSVDWIVETFQRREHVLDLGCGPGLYACELARRGSTVIGLDASRRSIDHAQRVSEAEGLPATFRVANYLEDDLGSGYDLALLIYEDYNALSPAQRQLLLRRAHDALNPGGCILFDVTASTRFDQARESVVREPDLMDGFFAPRPYEGIQETWKYPDLRLILDRYTITRGEEVRVYWNWMHCLTPNDVTSELAAAGLELTGLYGDVAGAEFTTDSVTFAVVAQRGRS